MSNPTWHEIFEYDPTVVTCLRWKRSRGKAKKGSPAGSYHKKGYYRVRYEKKNYLVHRVVYELYTGDILLPGDEVDHIDGNKENNRGENLRKVTDATQARNLGKYTSNTSGVTGVRYVTLHKREYAQAYWMEAGRKVFFQARCDLEIDAFELCILVREEAIAKLNDMGYGYTSDHGVRESYKGDGYGLV